MKSSRIKKILLYTSVILVFIYFAVSYFFANKVIAFPPSDLETDRVSLEIKGLDQYGLPTPKDGEFKNGDLTLKYWYFANPAQKPCGVVLVHGYGRTRWAMMKFAPLFWKKGCSLFAYDHRRHGESDEAFGTFGYFEKDDLGIAYKTFSEITNLKSEQIGVFGASYGAATALQWAGAGATPAFIIAESTYQDLDSIVGKKAEELYGSFVNVFIPLSYKIVEWRSDMIVEDVSPAKAAEKINIPVLVIHSKADAYTPYQHSEVVYKHLTSKKKQLALTDWNAPHVKSIDTNYAEFEKIVYGFLNQYNPEFFK
ncbi:MAG: alpha/beta hydrolase [Leptospira sp.]|nr:alpha/beta hydrolase [Leptospira sp.]